MTTKIVKYQDPRTVLPDPPIFGVPITALAINNYRLPASALSNTSIAFNNLVVLGKNQMYSNTFQIETEFEITMTTSGQATKLQICPDVIRGLRSRPFPLASVTDQVRINLNGNVFTAPVAYTLAARLQYMNQEDLIESYMNQCPCVIPLNHQETGLSNKATDDSVNYMDNFAGRSLFTSVTTSSVSVSETGVESLYFNESDGTAHPIFKKYRLCNQVTDDPTNQVPDPDHNSQATTCTFSFTTTEPIFCSPFASRLDANYGSPIMGIQSLDISLTLNDLRRAFLVYLPDVVPDSFVVNIKKCTLLYDVISTIPDPTNAITGPSYYPYRTIEPYITDFPMNPIPLQDGGVFKGSITSGVYTLTRVPTAVWVWIGPTKGVMQHFQKQSTDTRNLYSSENDYFAAIDHINITMGNTTQILNNASVLDLYRTSKANGCQLTFRDFSPPDKIAHYGFGIQSSDGTPANLAVYKKTSTVTPGPGTVLRLVPGLDLIMSDRDLVPGSACENVVFQLTADFRWLLNSKTDGVFNRNIALWLGFEYTGVIEIKDGTATLNTAPISVPAVRAAPMLRVASENIPARAFLAEGGGIFDKIWSGIKSGVRWLRDKKLVSKIARSIPHPVAQTVGQVADDLGFGYDLPSKRGRYYDDGDDIEGGAIMGLGDFT